MLCHPEPHPAVTYALRNVKSQFRDEAIKPVRMLFKQMEEILYPMVSADSAKF